MSPLGATGRAVFGLVIVATVAAGFTAARVHATLRPARHTEEEFDFAAVGLRARAVAFPATDGVPLEGWLLNAPGQGPPVLLCHPLGSSRGSMVNLAIELHRTGFPVLAFDFRGHGGSGGGPSTLGLDEKRDILGAIDFLAAEAGGPLREVGIYGVGMGAHAAVLAATDRRSIRVLVLDGLYPAVVYPLLDQVFGDWSLGRERLAFLPQGIFALLSGTPLEGERADAALTRLAGRDVLFLAPAGDGALAGEMRRMYESVPPQPDADGNLVVLPATQSQGLSGADRDHHQRRVAAFFAERLGRSS
jgi:pimeloyl-ACP methyl ester carboxylesterase